MQTAPNTPLEIFNMPQYLEIPLFQRPYVWNREDQWEPLWQDIRRMAELRVQSPGIQARHFLGAVVFQAQPQTTGGIATSEVIDGQQRLTTLQIVFDAASLAFEEAGDAMHAQQLRNLTHNGESYVPAGDQLLKLKHTNRDAAAFHEVMEATPPVEYGALKHGDTRIAKAHEYFADQVTAWLGVPDSDGYAIRAEALTRVLDSGLQVVTITLGADENSQEIFETLNARGTPLTAADLIKNLVFQRLAREGADTAHAYQSIWPFDTKFWEKDTSVGRSLVSRSSLFLNQWLMARLGEEISPQSTFTRFKSFMEHDTDESMKDVLVQIRDQAEMYQRWWENSATTDQALDRTSMCFYRLSALDSQILKPLIIWLYAPHRGLAQAEIDRTIAIAESWVMRRAMLRLSFGDLGRVLAGLLRGLSGVANDEVAAHVENQLALLNTNGTYWPGDEEVRRSLLSEPVYRKYPRKRLRAILEAVENSMRAETGGAQVTRWNLPIEHVLPRSWGDHWPVDDIAAQIERDAHVHRLGNLTLLTTSLNSRVSNSAWPNKREALVKHDTLLLNSRMVASLQGADWDEERIQERSRALADAVLLIWPAPEGHLGEVVDARASSTWNVTVRDLVVAGVLNPGVVLSYNLGNHAGRTATIRADGLIDLQGVLYETPSGAGRAIAGRPINGWSHWLLEDGRRLDDVRAAFVGRSRAEERRGFDWGRVHRILESLPEGSWTTYGALGDAVDTAAQPIANHLTSCGKCSNAHRVLRSDGSVAEGFAWVDTMDTRDPQALLIEEGVVFDGDVADPSQCLDSEDLRKLVSGDQQSRAARGVFRVSLGQDAAFLDDALAHAYVGTGWLPQMDLSMDVVKGRQDFHDKYNSVLREMEPTTSAIGAGLAVGQTWVVAALLSHGDAVLVPTGRGSYRVAIVAGAYRYEPGTALPHRRPVDWLDGEIPRSRMSEALRNSLQFNGTVQNLEKYADELEELLLEIQ